MRKLRELTTRYSLADLVEGLAAAYKDEDVKKVKIVDGETAPEVRPEGEKKFVRLHKTAKHSDPDRLGNPAFTGNVKKDTSRAGREPLPGFPPDPCEPCEDAKWGVDEHGRFRRLDELERARGHAGSPFYGSVADSPARAARPAPKPVARAPVHKQPAAPVQKPVARPKAAPEAKPSVPDRKPSAGGTKPAEPMRLAPKSPGIQPGQAKSDAFDSGAKRPEIKATPSGAGRPPVAGEPAAKGASGGTRLPPSKPATEVKPETLQGSGGDTNAMRGSGGDTGAMRGSGTSQTVAPSKPGSLPPLKFGGSTTTDIKPEALTAAKERIQDLTADKRPYPTIPTKEKPEDSFTVKSQHTGQDVKVKKELGKSLQKAWDSRLGEDTDQVANYAAMMGRVVTGYEPKFINEAAGLGAGWAKRASISRPKFDKHGNVVLTKAAKENVTVGKKSRKLTGKTYSPEQQKRFGEAKEELDEYRDYDKPDPDPSSQNPWMWKLREKKKKTVLVSPKGHKGAGKVSRIPKHEYDPKKHSLAEDQLDELKRETLASYAGKRAETLGQSTPERLKTHWGKQGLKGIKQAADRLGGTFKVGKPLKVMIPGKTDKDPASGPHKIQKTKLYKAEETQLDEGGPTKKHFKLAAETIKAIPDDNKRKEHASVHADLYSKQNPRFDRGKFLSACNVKEETELDEVITKDTPVKDVIHDFVHSDDKRFSGDSKKQRIKRALGAYYGKQRGE